ncbi:MAG: beta-eliminating lyase-related protein [Selenomonadaceae bacterium]|jgi:threonine aldolase|nr:beta-eliminating lyase-related protein [Selenomonadaceae bacterium]
MEKIMLASDYQEGAHPQIMQRLLETNLLATPGYGTDSFSDEAREKIRAACACPLAAVYFLLGGTQTNATVIDALLRSYEGVIAADSGHISVHEAGAIEFGGHKVLTLPHHLGKISAAAIAAYCENNLHDSNREHMVMPGMVYISQPTEYGTLYSLAELTAISEVCHRYHLPLYVDGARLAYALACPANDVTLPDLARLTDVFYIGGTKCGALFGEAVVIPDAALIPHFFTIIKQHGALLAKGRLLGIQFGPLFTDDLYLHIGQNAITAADKLRAAFAAHGYAFAFNSPTNQIFLKLTDKEKAHLDQLVESSFWEAPDADHTIVRLATSWATPQDKIEALLCNL